MRWTTIRPGLPVPRDQRETIPHVIHGLFPYSKLPGELDNHFSTIGVNGMNEMARNFSDDAHDLMDPRGFDMCAGPRIACERMVAAEATGHVGQPRGTARAIHLSLRQGGT